MHDDEIYFDEYTFDDIEETIELKSKIETLESLLRSCLLFVPEESCLYTTVRIELGDYK